MPVGWESLQEYSLFGAVNEEAIRYITSFVKTVEFDADEVIFKSGDRGDEICFILEGEVKIVLDNVELACLKEGQQFGEMHLIDVMPRSADVVGKSKGTLLVITNKDLMKLRIKDEEAFVLLLMNCSRDISRRLRVMNARYVDLIKPSGGGLASIPGL